jgi:hypothetical protein
VFAVRFVDAFLGADAAGATCKNDDGGDVEMMMMTIIMLVVIAMMISWSR